MTEWQLNSELKIKVSEPRRISPPGIRQWFPRLFHMPDGSILQFDTSVADEQYAISQPHGSLGRLSHDRGETWQEFAMPAHYGFPVALPGGRVRLFSYIVWQRDDGSTFIRSSDLSPGGKAWSEDQEAEIIVPQPVARDKTVPGLSALVFHRAVIYQPDGTLLATLCGYLEGDLKHRSMLLRSTDMGRTWHYVSTIAYDPELGSEGFNEPVMTRTVDGSLLAILRLGGRHYPLYQTRSLDDGQTWEPPQNLGVYSVDPEICVVELASRRILACSFGRPGANLMFSLDGNGQSWTKPVTLFTGNSTYYTGLRQVGPDRLLLVFDSNPEGTAWEAQDNQINAVFIDIG